MDLSEEQVKQYLSEYDLLTKEDIQKCAARADSLSSLEFFASNLHSTRKCERRDGIRHVPTQPLIHVLSAKVKSEKVGSEKDGQLAIYGEIYANYCDRGYWVKHELFKCEKDAPQVVGTNRILPLKGPDFLCEMHYGCMPLRRTRIVVKLFDQTGEIFEDRFFDPANELIDYDGFESLGSMEGDAITLRYIVIPHGVSCRMKIRAFPRHSADSLFYVNGRIAAKYANTYGGDPFSEECVLFDKQGHESEQVIIDTGRLNLSRCWLALSAYTALVVDVDLSIIGTDKKIVGTAKMFPENGWASSDTIVVDDYIVIVDAAWSPPEFFPLPKFMKRKKPSPSPSPSPALEIFTVFIGFGRTEAQVARVYGSIELDNDRKTCSIFKKDDQNALKTVSNRNSIPLLDGSRGLQDYLPLKMKVDVRDVDSSVAIKGFVDWDAQLLYTGIWHDKILCSIIRGPSGFVALHYAIFSKAVEAEITVDLALQLVEMGPWRCGVTWSLTAEYSCFEYSSLYNQKYHPIVLFKDFIDVPSAGWRDTVQLSRSNIVVPSHSSLIFVLTYKVTEGDDEEVRRVCKIGIGEGSKKVEAAGCGLLSTARIGIEWKEIK